jgi:TetR/AcrR family transcriptional regulator, transcriptional repressor for nem operon
MPTNPTDGRADTTRRHILRAASHQFARRAYHEVSLDDILTEAELTKGALYLHFRSKHALAVAIIQMQTAASTVAVEDLLSRSPSGLETLIDFSYLIAAQDIQTDGVRAGLNLLESVGRLDGMQERLLDSWVEALAVVVEKAIADGDVDKNCSPQDLGRLIVSLHMGLRRTSNLDEPERFLLDLEKSWHLVLSGILQPNRIDYHSQFVRRRTALAISTRSTGVDFD